MRHDSPNLIYYHEDNREDRERKGALRDLVNEISSPHRPLISRFWCSVEPKVATVTVTAAIVVGAVGVARDDEGGKCDGSQVLISAFRRDARDSKRRKNGWDVTGKESWCKREKEKEREIEGGRGRERISQRAWNCCVQNIYRFRSYDDSTLSTGRSVKCWGSYFFRKYTRLLRKEKRKSFITIFFSRRNWLIFHARVRAKRKKLVVQSMLCAFFKMNRKYLKKSHIVNIHRTFHNEIRRSFNLRHVSSVRYNVSSVALHLPACWTRQASHFLFSSFSTYFFFHYLCDNALSLVSRSGDQ